MKNKRKTRILALTMAVIMAWSALPVNSTFADAIRAKEGREISGAAGDHRQGDPLLTGTPSNAPEEIPDEDIVPEPEIPKCDCTERCTEEKSNADCPICTSGIDQCGFAEIGVILEKTDELLEWFDDRMELVSAESPRDTASPSDAASPSNAESPWDDEFQWEIDLLPLELSGMDVAPDEGFGVDSGMTLREKDGYILTEEDKTYFLECYDEIMALVDTLIESDFPAFEQLTENEDFRRLYRIAQVVGGYAVAPLAAVGTPTVQAQSGTDSSIVYSNGAALLICEESGATKIYWDKDRSGTRTAGDTEITGWSDTFTLGRGGPNVYGGDGSMNCNPLITMTGGNVFNIMASPTGPGTSQAVFQGETTVNISGGTVTNGVYGMGGFCTMTGSTHINISGGIIKNGVYGASTGGTLIGNSNVSITGGAVTGNVCGSSNNGSQTGDTRVSITGGTVTAGHVYGGGGSGGSGGKVNGNTNVIVGGNADISGFSVCGGGAKNQVSGNTNVTVKGNAKALQVRGGGGDSTATVGGTTTVTIAENAAVSDNVFAGGNASCGGTMTVNMQGGKVRSIRPMATSISGGTFHVNMSGGTTNGIYAYGTGYYSAAGTAQIHISGGTVTGNVAGGYNVPNQTGATGYHNVGVSGNPKIGDGTTNGIMLNTLSGNQGRLFGLWNTLTGETGSITLVPAPEAAVGNKVGMANRESDIDLSKFVVAGGKFNLYSNGINIYLGSAASPTIEAMEGKKIICANGTALVIEGTDATHTTVYIDTNRNGVKDAGELSLAAAGVVDAPPDSSDLGNDYIVSGASNGISSGSTLLTMNGGKVYGICGGGFAPTSTFTGNTAVNIKGGETGQFGILGGGHKGDITGNTNITMTGGSVYFISGGSTMSNAAVGGSTAITITGGTVTNTGNSILTGSVNDPVQSTSLTIKGGTVNGDIFGGGGNSAAIVKGTVNMNISEANTAVPTLLKGNIYAGASNSGPVNGAMTINISGGTMEGSVYCASKVGATVSAEKIINVSGTPKIGNKVNKGIDLSTLKENKVKISGALTGNAGDITLVNPASSGAVDIVVATANTASHAVADKFTLPGKILYADGANIKIGSAIAPTVKTNAENRPMVSGNGSALIVAGTDDTHTTVYWDKNRNGAVDTGDLSLKAAGISGAPIDNSDLSEWDICGGKHDSKSDGITTLTGDTLITVLGGKVQALYGGSYDAITDNGSTYINMTGGTVEIIRGGGYSNTLIGKSNVNITGGTVNSLIGGMQSGSTGGTNINVGGEAAVTSISGGSTYHSTKGDITITVSDKAKINNIHGGTGLTVPTEPPTPSLVTGNVTINLNGGTVMNTVAGNGREVTVNGTKTINVKGKPVIGDKATKGIDLSTVTNSKIYITGALTGNAGDITLQSTGIDTGMTVASANSADWADASKFIMTEVSKSVKKNGSDLVVAAAELPTVVADLESGHNGIFGNGHALVVVGTSPASATVYIDRNRNGTRESGEPSLSAARVIGAPADGADLSNWMLCGGWHKTSNSGEALVTVRGARLYSVSAGNHNSKTDGGGENTLTGSATVNVYNASIDYLYANGSNGYLVGDATLNIESGIFKRVTTGGWPNRITGKRTIHISGNVKIGSAGNPHESLDAVAVCYRGGGVSGTDGTPVPGFHEDSKINIGTLSSDSKIYLQTQSSNSALKYNLPAGTVLAYPQSGAALETARFETRNGSSLSIENGNLVLGAIPVPAFSKLQIRNQTADGTVVVDLLDPVDVAKDWALDTESDYYLFAQMKTQEDYIQIRYGTADGKYNGVTFANPPGGSFTPGASGFNHDYFDRLEKITDYENPPYGSTTAKLALRDGELLYHIKDEVTSDSEISFAVGIFVNDALYDGKNSILDAISVATGSYTGSTFTPAAQKNMDLKISDKNKMRTNMAHTAAMAELGGIGTTVQLNALVNVDTLQQVAVLYDSYAVDITYPKGATLEYGLNTSFVKNSSTYGTISLAAAGTETTVDGIPYVTRKLTITKGYKPLLSALVAYLRLDFPAGFATGKYDMTLTNPAITMPNGVVIVPETAGFNQKTIYTVAKGGTDGTTMAVVNRPDIYNHTKDMDASDYLMNLGSVYIKNTSPGSTSPYNKTYEVKYNTTNTAAEIRMITVPLGTFDTINTAASGEANGLKVTVTDGTTSVTLPDDQLLAAANVPGNLTASTYLIIYAEEIGLNDITSVTAEIGKIRAGYVSSTNNSSWGVSSNQAGAYGSFTDGSNGTVVASEYRLYNTDPTLRDVKGGELIVPVTATSTLEPRMGMNGGNHFLTGIGETGSTTVKKAVIASDSAVPAGDTAVITGAIYPYASRSAYTAPPTYYSSAMMMKDPVFYFTLPQGLGLDSSRIKFTLNTYSDRGKSQGSRTIAGWSLEEVSTGVYKIDLSGTTVGSYDREGHNTQLGYELAFTTEKSLPTQRYRLNDLVTLVAANQTEAMPYAGVNNATLVYVKPDTNHVNGGKDVFGITKDKDDTPMGFGVQQQADVVVTSAIAVSKIDGTAVTPEWASYSASNPNSIAMLGANSEGQVRLIIKNTSEIKGDNLRLLLPIPKKDADMGSVFMDMPQGFTMNMTKTPSSGSSGGFTVEYAKVSGSHDNMSNLFAAGGYTITTNQNDANALLITAHSLAKGEYTLYFDYTVANGTVGASDIFRPAYAYTVANDNRQNTGAYLASAVAGSKLTGIVFHDQDKNGVMDVGDTGVAGIAVQARDAQGRTETVTTDADGKYSFVAVRESAVTLTFTVQGSESMRFHVEPSTAAAGTVSTVIPSGDGKSASRKVYASGDMSVNAAMSGFVTLSYDQNTATGGSLPTDSEYASGDTATVAVKPDNLVKTGYQFKEWNTFADGSGTGYQSGATFTISGDTTLYAIWEISQYTITFHYRGATGGNTETSRVLIHNTRYDSTGALPKPTKTGYTFKGWTRTVTATTANVSDATKFTLGADTVLYAIWAPKTTFVVKYNTTGGSAIADKLNVAWDGEVLPSVTPVRTGYTFDGWMCGGTRATAATAFSDLAASDGDGTFVTLTATWRAKSGYTVKYDANGGSGTLFDKTNVSWSDVSLLPAHNPTKENFAFDGWTLGTTAQVVTATDSYGALAGADTVKTITLKAVWKEVSDNIVKYNSAGGTPVNDKNGVKAGDANLLPDAAPTKTGYDFDGWYVGAGKVENTTVYSTLTSARVLTLTAKWSAKNYTIHYEPNNGTTVGDATKSWLETGLLPGGALSKNGYTFDGWYYENTRVTASTTVSALIPADDQTELSLSARWIEKTYTVLYDTAGGNYISPRTGVKFTAVNLLPDTGAVKSGYHITGWQSGGTAVTDTTSLSTLNPVGTTVTIQAQWAVKSGYKVIYDANGGAFANDQTKNNVSWTELNLLPAVGPTRDGHVLTGWKSGRNTVTSDTVFSALAANDGAGTAVTLVAQWTEKADYKVRYESEYGSQIADKTGVKWNQRLLLPSETMVHDGWAFTGWYFGAGVNKVRVTNTDAYSAFAAANDEYIKLTAGWVEKSHYMIHFDTDGGGSIPSKNAVYYETMSNLLPTEIPTKYGDTFEGWSFTKPNGQVVDVKNSMTYKDLAEKDTVESITLKAKWGVKNFNLRYDENGGSEVEDRTLVLWTDSPILPADTSSRNGYSLAGWYYGDVLVTEDSTLGTICEDDSNAEVVLAAEWQENTYTITYDTDGGDAMDPKTGVSYTQDGLLPAKSPYKAGHTFAGWYYGDTEVVDGTPAITNEDGSLITPAVSGTACKDLLGDAANNITILELKAKWTVNRGYIVEYDTGGAGYLPDKTNVSWTETNLIPEVQGLTRSGYTLTGWTHGTIPVTESTGFDTLADSDLPGTRVVLTASWTENNRYTVKYDLKGGTQNGSGTMQDQTGVKWTQSGFLPSPNPERNHYVFGGWVMGENTVENDTPYSLLAGNADTVMEVMVAVKWMPVRENTVKYETGPGATVIADKTGVAWDDTGLLPANPVMQGFTFTGWKCKTEAVTAETKYSDCDDAISKTITLVAQWTENSYTVVYDTAGGNTISDKTGVKWADSALLPSSDPVREHYTFAGWVHNTTSVTATTKYSDLAADDTVDKITLAASWTDKPYTVKYNTDGGSALADKTVHWDKINLLPSAVPMKKDAVFSHWTYGGGKVTAHMTYKDLFGSAAATDEITLTAVYTAPTEDTGGVEGSIVTDTDGKPIANVMVSVHIGGTVGIQIAGPVKTGADGLFSFYGLPYGIYTLVATRELPSGNMQVITKTITISKDIANGDIIMPGGWKNTIVEVAPGTPAAAANGLDGMYKPGNVVTNPEEGVTQADHDAVAAGGSLEIKLLIQQKAVDDAEIAGDMAKVKDAVGANATMIPFDLSVLKTMIESSGASTSTGLTRLPQLIEIIIPMPELNGKNIKVLRVHQEKLHTLPYEEGGITEKAEYKNGNLHLTLRHFSTYAITYTNKGGGGGSGSGGGNGGGEQYYYVNLHAGEGGSFIPDTRRIKVRAGDSTGIDIVPKEGYDISDVVVNGKSVGAVSSYLIRNIRENHSISAAFVKKAEPPVPTKPETGETPKPTDPTMAETESGTGEMSKPANPNKPGTNGGSTIETPKQTQPIKPAKDTTQENVDNLLRDLKSKHDGAMDSLPDALTKAQRTELIDELSRIYEKAAEGIQSAKSVNQASQLFNEAIYDLEEVLSRFGVMMPIQEPEDEPSTGKPFILISALLALMALILAVLSFRKRKEDQQKKHNRMLTIGGAAGSMIIFLLTTGWNGVAFANAWTVLVAVGTGIGLYGFVVRKKE